MTPPSEEWLCIRTEVEDLGYKYKVHSKSVGRGPRPRRIRERMMIERKHLKRLSIVYQSHPRYFISVCVYRRRNLLTRPAVHKILLRHWAKSLSLYGWAIGSYVVMPDHIHFFCTDAESRTTLSNMVGSFKQWTAKEICPYLGVEAPFWQQEFFDHLLRSDESYSDKWEYIRQNPVADGLVASADDWKYSGHIDYV